MANTACTSTPTTGTEPEIFLLWRHSPAEATALVRRGTSRHLVLVRLVNQAMGQGLLAASEQGGHEVVTLPMAFAGLHEGDQVLRHAVMRQLHQRPTQSAVDAASAYRAPNSSRRMRANSVLS